MASPYSPSPIQQQFHVMNANEILLGGAAGPGKSLALLMDPIQTQLLSEHARWKAGEIPYSVGWAIHFRREFPRLEQTIERSKRIFPLIDRDAHFDLHRHLWTFSCGYRIQFGHIHHDDDMTDHLSNEYSHIAWDELGEFDNPEVYQFVNTRLRSSDHVLQQKLRIVAASNPTGNWVRDYFVEPAKDGWTLLRKTILLDDGSEEQRTRVFIPATLKDNPDEAFRRRYEIELQDKPAHIRRALLYGDWWVIAGAFFANEFTPAHVVEPFTVPSGWPRFRSMDWGYKSKGVVHWWAVNKDGDLLCYRELTFERLDAVELGRKVREIEEANDEWDHKGDCSLLSGPADTQIWEQRGTVGPTIAEHLGNEGVFFEKATKNRHASVQEFLRRLKDRSGEQKIPAIRFFSTCKNTIRTIPAIGTDKTDPELPVDGGEDHWLDSVLYACMYRAANATSDEKSRRNRELNELEEARERRNRRADRASYGFAWGSKGRRR